MDVAEMDVGRWMLEGFGDGLKMDVGRWKNYK